MMIYVQLKIYCVSLYEMNINMNDFSFILRISLHVVMCVTENFRVIYLRYNVQFNIWYHDKTPSCVKPRNFWKHIWIKFNYQALNLLIKFICTFNSCMNWSQWFNSWYEIEEDTYVIDRFNIYSSSIIYQQGNIVIL